MFGIFKRMKQNSEAINTYCWDAMKAFLFLSDNVASEAMIVALVVMGNDQRNSNFKAILHFTDGIKSELIQERANLPPSLDLPALLERISKIRTNIEAVSKMQCNMSDIAKLKSHLATIDEPALNALNSFDGDFFKRKHRNSDIFSN